ncbi:MAG TPA: hypothetical protein PKA82_15275 [Pyrinomonadaceae bacterium]|nr:hypothetical protein [Pyrinomonadaceae bacterium]
MSFTKESAAYAAIDDLAKRLSVAADDVTVTNIKECEFPNSALGALTKGEIAGMMMSDGWEYELSAEDETYIYRADSNQLRLVGYNGENIIVEQ